MIETVERIVEDIIEVPIIKYDEVVIERKVERINEIERIVEVPQVHKRIISRPVEKIEEEIIEVPKIR